jgi:hypothetical protein
VPNQWPVTISACCPAASAGLPVTTSFRRGVGPGGPHDQEARGQQPRPEHGQQVAGGAGERQAPEPSEADERSGAKEVTASPLAPAVRPLVPGVRPEVPEVPVLPPLPGVPEVPVSLCPGGWWPAVGR